MDGLLNFDPLPALPPPPPPPPPYTTSNHDSGGGAGTTEDLLAPFRFDNEAPLEDALQHDPHVQQPQQHHQHHQQQQQRHHHHPHHHHHHYHPLQQSQFLRPALPAPPPPQQEPEDHPAAAAAAAAVVEAAAASPPRTARTVVDGLGMWNSWTRNFNTPAQAMLDLVDNAFDAAADDGKVRLQPDKHQDNGLTMFNTCRNPVAPLREVLVAFNSDKGPGREHIGENGVGLKQGAATLSDCSFVLTRNMDKFCLGVIAKKLQSKQGMSLPSFILKNSDVPGLEQELLELFLQPEHHRVGEIVAEYGKQSLELGSGDSLENGVRRLVSHFEFMTSEFWGPYAFGLILCDIKQGDSSNNNNSNTRTSFRKANSTLEQLEKMLPKHYIHVPKTFKFYINDKPLQFLYWQRRLVNLSRFAIAIDPTEKITPMNVAKTQTNTPILEANQGNIPGGIYTLHVYVGFDVKRLADPEIESSAQLLWYSRKAGRLIRSINDARGTLGLTAGGTNFCQGLTVIVDDLNGRLPLNPTKQDIAFAEQGAAGEIHRENLLRWVGAVAKVYWNYFHEECYEKKKLLTAAVRDKLDPVNSLISNSRDLKGLSDCRLDKFVNLGWTMKSNHISTKSKKSIVLQRQADTLVRICKPLPPAPQPPPAPRALDPAAQQRRLSDRARAMVVALPRQISPQNQQPRRRSVPRKRSLRDNYLEEETKDDRGGPPLNRQRVEYQRGRYGSGYQQQQPQQQQLVPCRTAHTYRGGPAFNGLPIRFNQSIQRPAIAYGGSTPGSVTQEAMRNASPGVAQGEAATAQAPLRPIKQEEDVDNWHVLETQEKSTLDVAAAAADEGENGDSLAGSEIVKLRKEIEKLKETNADKNVVIVELTKERDQLKMKNDTFKLQVAKLHRKVKDAEKDAKEWERLCEKLQGCPDPSNSSDEGLLEGESADV